MEPRPLISVLLSFTLPLLLQASQNRPVSGTRAAIELLRTAQHEAQADGARYIPILSPYDKLLGSTAPVIDFKAVQAAGFRVVVWTVDDPDRMRELIRQGIDGIISDRPDLLRNEAEKARASALSSEDRSYFERFDAEGHRGGRDLRPENTLPAFEAGLDNLVTTLETDTGVTKDLVSLISHEQFINPQTCRESNGSQYSTENKVWIKDITMAEAQKRFICDRVFRGPEQKNDLSLSPVAVAFAREKGLVSPYVPTHAAQLFDFAAFYATYYKSGPGKSHPDAERRWHNAAKVRFNVETKITPESSEANHTFGPDVFTRTLGKTIEKAKMEARCDIQSFDFRTLELAQRNYPEIQTVYLIESTNVLH
jgi:glycerophosphoryl diester phosphodiesterase